MFSKPLKAADTLTLVSVENTSYNYYLQSDWKNLGLFCDHAIANGFDYYLIRVRAGIAWFEQKAYRKATLHFEKAIEFNSTDFAKEYLYYCFIYTERYEDARYLSKSFDSLFMSSLIIKQKPVAFVSLEGGIKLSGERKSYNNALFGQLNLSHYLSGGMPLFHALSYYSQDEWRFSVKQYQYYLQIKPTLKKKLQLAAAGHFVYSDINTYDTFYVEPPPVKKEPYFTKTQTLGFIGSIQLTRHTSLFDYSIGSSGMFFDSATQYQLTGGITWFPLKNNRLAIGGNIYLHALNDIRDLSIAYAPSVSAYLSNRFQLSASYFTNNGYNITEHNGYFVNNSVDKTTSRWLITGTLAVSNKIHLYGTYVFENKIANSINTNYNYQVFMLGIRMIPR